jgi:signal transduction histidine kinase
MSSVLSRIRVPLTIQVGLVAAMFLAALIVLWITGASVVARERRRSEVKADLDRAGDELARRGREIIAETGEFPDYPEANSRDELDAFLASRSREVLSGSNGIEGGFFVVRYKGFLGTVRLGHAAADDEPATKSTRVSAAEKGGRSGAGLPPLEADLIDIQVDAAIRKKQVLFSVSELDGGHTAASVAIRTSPIEFEGRAIGASWVMTRLVEPIFVDRSLKGYRLATWFALAGIALSFTLTAGLARTVRRQAEERERLQTDLRRSERLAALGKLLAGVAHEVRNPLAGIRSTAQLWQRGFERDAESLDGLIHEVDRLEKIVSRLLQFSRADAQDLAPGDLNAVVSEAARLALSAGEESRVRIELDLDPRIPPVNMAPPALLQVFRNLTRNALQAMSGGGTIRLTTRFDPARHAAFATVSDTGPGLPPDAIGHMFEPFFTTKSEGTGLGLAIAREIALAHRGELVARNREDRPGASFTLTLPAGVPEPRANGAVA